MRLISIIAALLLLTGCVRIKHGDSEYVRWGDQTLEGVKVTTPEGTIIELGKQNAEGAALERMIEFMDKRLPTP